jgi:exodeoxyribonuclease VII small subunit
MPKTKERQPGFETSLSALEKIVAQLESGDLPLERALELFEDGVGLARRCKAQLEEAERKVEMLLRERGEVKAVPFDPSRDEPRGEKKNARAQADDLPEDPEEDEGEEIDGSIPF